MWKYVNTTWTNKKKIEIIHFEAKKLINQVIFCLKSRGESNFSWSFSNFLKESFQFGTRMTQLPSVKYIKQCSSNSSRYQKKYGQIRARFWKIRKFASQKRCFLCDAKWQIFEKLKFWWIWVSKLVSNVISYWNKVIQAIIEWYWC